MIVTVIDIERTPIGPETMWVFVGLTDDGSRLRFAADHRPGLAIAMAMGEEDTVTAEVPDYMMLGVMA